MSTWKKLSTAEIKKRVSYFRNPYANIVTIRAQHLSPEVARTFGLVPDNHRCPNWYKVVVMDHVSIEKLMPLVAQIEDLCAPLINPPLTKK